MTNLPFNTSLFTSPARMPSIRDSFRFLATSAMFLFASQLASIQAHPASEIKAAVNQSKSIHLYVDTSAGDILANDTFEPPFCDTDAECIGQPYTVCMDNQCHCLANYHYVLVGNNSYICKPFKCFNHWECQDWDANMACSPEQTCVCRKDYFAAHHDRKCVPMSGGINWLLYLTIIPIILVIVFCVYICIRLGRSSPTLRERATNFKRRMSRKFSVITGVSLSGNNINNNKDSKDTDTLPRSISQTDI